jgi:hypothetical protein
MQSIAVWIQATSRKVEHRERRIKWRALKTILHSFDCECDVLQGNRIRITRAELSTHVYYTDEGREVEPNTVHKIREDLMLDEQHGYDSAIFYNREDRILSSSTSIGVRLSAWRRFNTAQGLIRFFGENLQSPSCLSPCGVRYNEERLAPYRRPLRARLVPQRREMTRIV